MADQVHIQQQQSVCVIKPSSDPIPIPINQAYIEQVDGYYRIITPLEVLYSKEIPVIKKVVSKDEILNLQKDITKYKKDKYRGNHLRNNVK